MPSTHLAMAVPTISSFNPTGKSPRPTAVPFHSIDVQNLGHGGLVRRYYTDTQHFCGYANFYPSYLALSCTSPFACAFNPAVNVQGCCDVYSWDACAFKTTCIDRANWGSGYAAASSDYYYTAFCTDAAYPYCVTVTFPTIKNSPTSWICEASQYTNVEVVSYIAYGSPVPTINSGSSTSSFSSTSLLYNSSTIPAPLPSTPTPTPTSTPTPTPTPVGAIAGGAIGGVVAIALICAVLYYFMKKNKGNKSAAQALPASQHDGVMGAAMTYSSTSQTHGVPSPLGSPPPQYGVGYAPGSYTAKTGAVETEARPVAYEVPGAHAQYSHELESPPRFPPLSELSP